MAGNAGLDPMGHAILPSGARLRRLRATVLTWFDSHGRAIDFRTSADPYGILVGEVMAQQTQIARVEPAWRVFMARFPTPATLASARLGDVLRAWAGLGYNRRAWNLQRAAISITHDHDGRLPRTVPGLEQLPGVGPYTARAVAAVAFGVPVGAVDTNVRRVVTRMLGGNIGGARAVPDTEIQRAADALVDPARPADWTHALMDIGSTVCRGERPICARCPLRPWCAFERSEDVSVRAAGRAMRRRRNRVRFQDTSRWLRGRLIERLIAQPRGRWLELSAPIGTHSRDAVRAALQALERESLVERDRRGRARIRESSIQTPARGKAAVRITRNERTRRTIIGTSARSAVGG